MNSPDALNQILSHVERCPDKTCMVCQYNKIARAVLEADARALWAVRVLDAWAKVHSRPAYWKTRVRFDGENECALFYTNGAKFIYRLGPTPDAAREVAALAVWPELSADVRQQLGERP